MPSACFVDANVLVYTLDPREPAKRARAAAWCERLWVTGAGRTSTQVLSEAYNILRRIRPALPAATLWEAVALYFAWKPRAVDHEVLKIAYQVEQRYRVSWWDSLIVAAAQLQDCELLLTEDLQDGMKFGSVTVRSPFTLEVREAQAGYAALPHATSPHRPRGRPRRAVPA